MQAVCVHACSWPWLMFMCPAVEAGGGVRGGMGWVGGWVGRAVQLVDELKDDPGLFMATGARLCPFMCMAHVHVSSCRGSVCGGGGSGLGGWVGGGWAAVWVGEGSAAFRRAGGRPEACRQCLFMAMAHAYVQVCS
jgi:hypothetical protein